jgi:hypothetical protein
LTKPCLNYEWTKECEKAFYTFQTTFTQGPILITLDWNKVFHVQIDAPNMVVGAI